MRLFIISGEASGDLHGSNLIYSLKSLSNDLEVEAWGGDLMAEAGARIKKHYKDLAFMGFSEVVKNIFTILRNFKQCKNEILGFKPDAIVLIDYPGFNLRMAKWAKKKGFKVIYYIAPQLWAWHTSRVTQLVKYTDKVISILPFEKKFFSDLGLEVMYVGHPLLDSVNAEDASIPKERSIIALLPGSRKQEIRRLLPIMNEVAKNFPSHSFSIAGRSSIGSKFYFNLIDAENITLEIDKTYEVLKAAQAAVVGSGTATLETALFNVPQVVVYAGNKWSYQLAKRLVKVTYISLVNLILEKSTVAELIQENMNEKNISVELERILGPDRLDILNDYKELKIRLGESGASKRAAEIILASV